MLVNSFKWKHYEGEINYPIECQIVLKIFIKLYKFRKNDGREGSRS